MLGMDLLTMQLSQQTQKEAKCKPFLPSIFWLCFVKRWPTEICLTLLMAGINEVKTKQNMYSLGCDVS